MILEDRQWKIDMEKWRTDAAVKPAPRREEDNLGGLSPVGLETREA